MSDALCDDTAHRTSIEIRPQARDRSTKQDSFESDSHVAKRRKLGPSNGDVRYQNGIYLAPMKGQKSVRILHEHPPSSSIFETHPLERSKLIFQIGSAHVDQALQAAKKVVDLVAGVGLNCGCPKSFSVHGGMGAELLKVPDKLCAILQNLVDNLSVPVSCKIRLLPDQAATISLVRRIAETGIVQLTVHCRTQEMRPREPALLHRLRQIVDAMRPYGIPVAANGDCFRYEDIDRIMNMTGVTSVMIARGAERNVSVFRSDGALDPVEEVVPRFLQVARAVSQPWGNAKYCLNAMDLGVSPVIRSKKQRNAIAQRYMQAKSVDDACKAFGLEQIKSLEELLPHLTERDKVSEREEVAHTTHSSAPTLISRCAPASTLLNPARPGIIA